MKVTRIAFVAVALTLASAAFADTTLVSKMHQDAIPMAQQPAKDYQQTIWMGKDAMRVDGENTVIVRLDQKKMFVLDAAAKTASSIDLPIDYAKLVPAEAQAMLQQMAAMKMTVKVTPSAETKKIKEWNAKRYDIEMSSPMGLKMNTVVWATKDVKVDFAKVRDMLANLQGLSPMLADVPKELMKIDGVTAMSEMTMAMGETPVKITEELISVDEKPAPAGTYDVPKDFTVKPFNLMEQMQRGH